MHGRTRYIMTETLISVAINGALSVAFVFLLFHGRTNISVTGLHGVIADMAPQTFMIVLMSFFVPALLTRRRMAAQALRWHDSILAETRFKPFPRALASAVIGACIIVVASWLVLPHLLPPTVAFRPLLLAKATFGCTSAAIVTPWAIRSALR